MSKIGTSGRLSHAAIIVMSSMILSRLTGFVREVLVPTSLGIGEWSDSYNMAFRITGLMYDLLVGGAISAALIPTLSGYLARGEEEEGWKVTGALINIIMLGMVVFCTLGIIFAPWIVSITASGFKSLEQQQLTVTLTRILFPSVALLMLAGLANGILNSYHKFAASSYGPTIYNVFCSLSIYFLIRKGIQYVAYGIVCSSLIYFLFQFSFLIKKIKFYKFKIPLKHPGVKKLFNAAVPALLSSAVVQVNTVITASFATFFDQGSVTSLNMADRTWQMPFGIFAQGVGIAILPTLAAYFAVGKIEEYKDVLIKGIRSILFAIIPSVVGFIILGETIVYTIFKFNRNIQDSSIHLVAVILSVFCIALIAQSVVVVVNRAFYAKSDTKTPLYTGASTVVVTIGFSFLFFYKTSLGAIGTALAYSLSSVFNAMMLLFLLNKNIKDMHFNKLWKPLIKITVAAVIMGIVVAFINSMVSINLMPKIQQFIYLGMEIFLGAAIYGSITYLFRIEEAILAKNYVMKILKISRLTHLHIFTKL